MRLFLFFSLLIFSFQGTAQEYFLFVGTYTNNGSKGIYVYKFNAATGEAKWVSNTDSAANPSYLSLSPGGKYVYAVYEEGGQKNGQVSAYAFDRATGRLRFLNQQPTGGDHPCYVSNTRDNKWVAVANYTGGNFSVFPVHADGSLKPAVQTIQHEGSGANKARQAKPHVHAAVFSPKDDYLFVPDLGIDKVKVYKFSPSVSEPLKPAEPAFAASEAGAVPGTWLFIQMANLST